MQMQTITLENLTISPLNVRKSNRTSVEDLVPSIEAMGILQPLLVRPKGESFEIVAGQRRYQALKAISETHPVDPVPCLVMEQGEDAKAIEASLAENLLRLPMDAIDQFEAFHALAKQGQSGQDIALRFGVSERLVTQRLALATLYAPIRNAFRRAEIDLSTLQTLTLASKSQQKRWYKLHASEEDYAPQGWQLKKWLFGGEEIPISNALFDPDSCKGGIVTDLFGEESYFADSAAFWDCQNRAIAERMQSYRDAGWTEVVLMDVGSYWSSWDYADVAQEEGGKVYLQVSAHGEVTAHEGKLPHSELRRRNRAGCEDAGKPERPELTKQMQNYLALHRHAAVRSALLDHPKVALRLCVAQLIAGSANWSVNADGQKAQSKAVEASLAGNPAQETFAKEKRRILALLGIEADTEEGEVSQPLVSQNRYGGRHLCCHELFAKLMTLDDAAVTDILTFVVAETLESASATVEGLGVMLGVNMADHWQPDQTFYDLLRDKQAVNTMLAEIGGQGVADANVTATAKTQKHIIEDCRTGNGRTASLDWQPRYMAFPMQSYTERGGIDAIRQYDAISEHYPMP